MIKIKVFLIGMLIGLSVLSACIVPGRHGRPEVIAPPLPPFVVLGDEPYYYYGNYYYRYDNDAWYYSRSRRGPDWHPLPRERYPNEFTYRGRHWHRDRGWER
ncbi:MAG: hypothetical protein WA666_05440 [Nitrospirota bacterium]